MMSAPVRASDLDLIVDKVRRAGALAQHLKSHGLITKYKADGSIVTNADTEVNLWLKEALLDARPGYGWQSEEEADNAHRLDAARTFVLDPIDGTMGLSRGSPYWTIALAVIENNQPVAAVVYAPDAAELYSAAIGEGATLNGGAIRASRRAELEGAEAGELAIAAFERRQDSGVEMRRDRRILVRGEAQVIGGRHLEAVAGAEPDIGNEQAAAAAPFRAVGMREPGQSEDRHAQEIERRMLVADPVLDRIVEHLDRGDLPGRRARTAIVVDDGARRIGRPVASGAPWPHR